MGLTEVEAAKIALFQEMTPRERQDVLALLEQEDYERGETILDVTDGWAFVTDPVETHVYFDLTIEVLGTRYAVPLRRTRRVRLRVCALVPRRRCASSPHRP